MSWPKTLAWGITGRCPNCGSPGIFRQWLQMKEHCPRCGIQFERDEGYWTGAMGINIIVTSLVFVFAMVVSFWLTWPDVPVARVLIGMIILNTAFPILFYPYSKTIWTALDLIFHPLERDEQERARSIRRLKEQPNPEDGKIR